MAQWFGPKRERGGHDPSLPDLAPRTRPGSAWVFICAWLILGGIIGGTIGGNRAFAAIPDPEFARQVTSGKAVPVQAGMLPTGLTSVRVYYRPLGTQTFNRLDLPVPADGQLAFSLPARVTAGSGIEFYLEATTPTGRVITAPASYPRYNPYRIAVGPAPSPPLALLTPSAGSTVTDAPRQLVIGPPDAQPWNPSQYRLLVDGVDVTRTATLKDGQWRYQPATPPTPGGHVVELVARDDTAPPLSWSFNVAAPDAPSPKPADGQRGELFVQGGLSANYGAPVMAMSGTGTTEQMSANMGLAFGMKTDSLDLSWQGVNLQYTNDGGGEDLTIASGFTMALSRWGQTLEYGDITVQESALTAPSFARRGAQLKLNGLDTEVRLFDVRADTVEGFHSGLSGGSGRQVYGASLRRALLPNERLKTGLVYITGQNGGVAGFNSTSTDAPTKGTVAALTVEDTLGPMQLTGELASSRYDINTLDGVPDQSGMAGTVDLSATVGAFSLGAGYEYYHPDFASIANPNFTTDREGVHTQVGTNLAGASLSAALSWSRDNVLDDPTRPVVHSTGGTLSLGLPLTDGVSLSLNGGHTVQDSQGTVGTPVKNTKGDAGASLTFSGNGWSSGLSANWGFLNDLLAGQDVLTRNYALQGSVSPTDRFSANGSATLAESQTARGAILQNYLYTVSGSLPVLGDVGTTDFQVSLATNVASDDSQDTVNVNGSWRISLNLHQWLKPWIDYGQETLAFSFNYSNEQDRNNNTNDREDYTGFVSLNINAPIQGRRGF